MKLNSPFMFSATVIPNNIPTRQTKGASFDSFTRHFLLFIPNFIPLVEMGWRI